MKTGILVTTTIAALGLAVCPAVVLAGTPIDESRAAKANGVVTIENLIGPVTVTGWNKNEVQVTGTLGEGPERLDFEVDGKRTTIEVVWPDRNRWSHDEEVEETTLEVRVPAGSEVRIEGVNTDIEISGVEGMVELQTVNGNITITGGPEEIEAGTVNGDIDVESSSESINVETVNGDLRILGARGEVSGASVNGDITITGELQGRGEFGNVSGDIEFDGNLGGRGPYEFSSHSGSVVLNLPRNISARFEIETFSGDIDNDFGPKAERTSQYAPGKELSFRTGDGETRIEASSFSGSVEIREK
jgi:hypothetical protein